MLLVWAAEALQNDRVEVATHYIRFPEEAANAAVGSPFFMPPWELETLVNELLVVPKAPMREGPNRRLNSREFMALRDPINSLRKLENAEAGFFLKRMSVLWELPRIAYRQFAWQRGFFNRMQLYRWGFLFAGDGCQAYYKKKFGISISAFSMVAFGLYGHFDDRPAHPLTLELPELGLSAQDGYTALQKLSIDHRDARSRAAEIRNRPYGIAYQPSLLRQTPLIRFGARLRCPLRELLITRITSDLYYDLVDGPGALRNEIADRFERYCFQFTEAMLPAHQVGRSCRYRSAPQPLDSPDVVVASAEGLRLAIECKATKMTFDAQFSEDPINQAERGFAELAKGVFQLWRYFSHIRRGVAAGKRLAQGACGLVLTLDDWLTASNDFELEVFKQAEAMCLEKDAEIQDIDKLPIVFSPIHDFEMTLLESTEEGFFGAVGAATEKRFSGWSLLNVHGKVGTKVENEYPFQDRLGEVLQWWQALEELEAARR